MFVFQGLPEMGQMRMSLNRRPQLVMLSDETHLLWQSNLSNHIPPQWTVLQLQSCCLPLWVLIWRPTLCRKLLTEINSSHRTLNCRNLIKIQFDGQNFPFLIKQNIYIFNHITGENNEATISRGWRWFTHYKRGSFMVWPTRLVLKSSVRNFSMPVSKYCCIPVKLDRWCNGLNSINDLIVSVCLTNAIATQHIRGYSFPYYWQTRRKLRA